MESKHLEVLSLITIIVIVVAWAALVI